MSKMPSETERTSVPDPEFYDKVLHRVFQPIITYGEGLRHPLWSALHKGFKREVRYDGAENLHEQTGPFIEAITHRHLIDPMVIADVMDEEGLPLNMIAKEEIWHWPVIGGLIGRSLERGGTMPLKRGAWFSPETIEDVKKIVNTKGIVGIFPEEHRRKGDIVERENISIGVAALALEFNLNIVPVGLDGTEKTKRGPLAVVFGKAISPPDFPGFNISSMKSVVKARGVLEPMVDRLHAGMQTVQDRAIELRNDPDFMAHR